jgi:hypothetical protein
MFDLETNISIPLALYLVAVAKVTSHHFLHANSWIGKI